MKIKSMGAVNGSELGHSDSAEKREILKTLATISSTMAALCLAILIFSLETNLIASEFSKWLWGAVILFAVTSFRCLDTLMDEISDTVGKDYSVWSAEGGCVIIDKRLADFGFAVLWLICAWVFFSIAMLFISSKIGISPLWEFLGFLAMLFCAFQIATRRP
jgi:hypothetical protein